MLIGVEGPNGAGKTTFIKLLKDILNENDIPFIITSWNSYEPSKYLINSEKDIMGLKGLTHFYSHLLDFAFRIQKEVEPAINSGKWVIFDRYEPTSIIRDGIRGVDKKLIKTNYSYFPDMDVTFFLDTDLPILKKRMHEQLNTRSPYILGKDIWTTLTDKDSVDLYLESQLKLYRSYFSAMPNIVTIHNNDYTKINLKEILFKKE